MNFLVIGCGMLAQMQHIPNLAQSPKASLYACCDVSTDVLETLQKQYPGIKKYTDYVTAIDDSQVQAVCLATGQNLRYPVIEACAKAGKPIYVEKPIAATLSECYEIQRLLAQYPIPFCAGHNRRSSPAMRDAHTIFRRHMENPQPCSWRFDREGAEKPYQKTDGIPGISVRINDDWYSWKKWVWQDPTAAQYGAMLFEMTHFTDICNWFMDDAPVEVSALSTGDLNHGVIIEYQKGGLATIFMTGNGILGYPKELYEFFGSGAAVVVDHMAEIRTAGIKNAPTQKNYPFSNDRYPNIGREGGIAGWLKKCERAQQQAAQADPQAWLSLAPSVNKGHRAAIDYFVDEITGEGATVCGLDDAVLATKVAFAAIQSTRERRSIRLD